MYETQVHKRVGHVNVLVACSRHASIQECLKQFKSWMDLFPDCTVLRIGPSTIWMTGPNMLHFVFTRNV